MRNEPLNIITPYRAAWLAVMPPVTLLVTSLFWAGCDGPELVVDCDAQGSVTGSVEAVLADGPVASDLVVRGTVVHSEGRNIRRVTVAGVDAENQGFAFDTWSASIPIEILIADADPGTDEATVSATAIDACGDVHDIGEVTVVVDRNPGIQVDRLDLTVIVPNGQTYIPATLDVSALIRLTANAKAAGARASLSADSGQFVGLDGDSVVLSGDGSGDASATVLFTSSTPGQVIITASAKDDSDIATIRVAGPPSFSTPVAEVQAGQSIPVSVDPNGGAVQACQASIAQGLSATSAGQDLAIAPGGQDTNGDGKIDILITAANPIAQPATLTVTCRDPFGQTSSGMYSVAP